MKRAVLSYSVIMPLRPIHSFRHAKKRWLFLSSLCLTIVVMLGILYSQRESRARAASPRLLRIDQRVFLTSQLYPEQMKWLKAREVRTLIDMRPDGEAENQPPSSEMQSAATARGLVFYYIPVPHDSIPAEDVVALDKALTPETRTCLYCRTGRRAVRLYALVQASRADGPEAGAILEMVKNAGFSADDLKDEIAQRIAHRDTKTVTAHP